MIEKTTTYSRSANQNPPTPHPEKAPFPEGSGGGRIISPHGYTDDYGPNVSRILCQGSLVVAGRIPSQVRKELAAAVKAKVLGRLPKDGLKPEIFFHPSHKNGAIDRQKREAAYAVSCIAKVMASPAEVREGIERNGGDPLEYALNDFALSKATGGQHV